MLRIVLTKDRNELGRWVAKEAGDELIAAIDAQGYANMVVATGSSQFEVLRELVRRDDVDWNRVTGFHLDEYIGIASNHPASFCGYLKDRFVDKVPLADFHFLDGEQDPESTIDRVGTRLSGVEIDVALVGIGENGHLAFNDPPADFQTRQPYLVVELDEPCRRQQVGEGWFASLDEVPTHAISMSVQQILKAKSIYCSVPDDRKSEAVRNTVEGDIDPTVPASILRSHEKTTLVVDQAAASRLSDSTRQNMDIVS